MHPSFPYRMALSRGLELEFSGFGMLEALHALFQFLVDGIPDLPELPLVPRIHSAVGKVGKAADAFQGGLIALR
jgi:hypothetical protein